MQVRLTLGRASAVAARIRQAVREHPRAWWGLCASVAFLVSILSMKLRRVLVVPIVAGAGLDDDLFQRQAGFLVKGEWLGTFDGLTLVKGPGYPALIALADRWGVRLKDLEQLSVLLAGLCLAACLYVVTRRVGLATFAYTVVALDPSNYSVPASRVLRQNWYGSLAMITLCALFLAVYASVTRISWAVALFASALAGPSFAIFWLTREEGSALLPAVAVLVVALPVWAALRGARAHPPGPRRRRRTMAKGLRLALVLAVFAATGPGAVAWVAHRNAQEYGVALTNDVGQGELARAYADWAEVKAGTRRRYVPINQAQREAVYAVSSTARILRPKLEDPANHWRKPGCFALKICDDYAGGWEIWALRSSGVDLGYFASGPTAQRFYGRLADEIEAACADGRLQCERHLPSAVQPFRHLPLGPVAVQVVKGVGFALEGEGGDLSLPGVRVSDAERGRRADLVRDLFRTQAAEDAHHRALRGVMWRYRLLREVYLVMLAALIAATVGGLVAVARRRRPGSAPVVILLAVAAVGAGCRAFLLGVFDATQFPTDGSAYHAATRTMLFMLLLAGAALVVGCRPAPRQRQGGSDVRVELASSGIGMEEHPGLADVAQGRG